MLPSKLRNSSFWALGSLLAFHFGDAKSNLSCNELAQMTSGSTGWGTGTKTAWKSYSKPLQPICCSLRLLSEVRFVSASVLHNNAMFSSPLNSQEIKQSVVIIFKHLQYNEKCCNIRRN